MLSVKDHFKQPRIKDHRFDVFGKNVAINLCDLSNSQRVLAEKLINDILFETEMNNLTISHKLVQQNQQNYGPYKYDSASPSKRHSTGSDKSYQVYNYPQTRIQTEFNNQSFIPFNSVQHSLQIESSSENSRHTLVSYISNFTNDNNNNH